MSTFWLYVRIQLGTFVVGIVGPIFLGVYFASQPDPTLKWIYWFGLFITAADVLIALSITNYVTRADAIRAKRSAKRQDSPDDKG